MISPHHPIPIPTVESYSLQAPTGTKKIAIKEETRQLERTGSRADKEKQDLIFLRATWIIHHT